MAAGVNGKGEIKAEFEAMPAAFKGKLSQT